MTTPLMRLPPSGPAVDPALIVIAGMGPFAVRHRRADPLQNYDAVNGLSSALFANVVTTNPVIPNTQAQLEMALPTVAPPAGYVWALEALFTGICDVTFDEGGSTHVGLRIQYQDAAGDWVALSPSGSGTFEQLVQVSPATLALAFHAIRNQVNFSLAALATSVQVRVGWSKVDSITPAANSVVRMRTNTSADLENGQLGGWDFTVRWVLRSSGDII